LNIGLDYITKIILLDDTKLAILFTDNGCKSCSSV